MPNHIKNRLTFSGPKTQINKLINKFSTTHPRILNKTEWKNLIICQNSDGKFVGWYDETLDEFEYVSDKGAKIKGLPKDISYEYNEELIQMPDFNKIVPRPESLDISSSSSLMPLENRFSENTLFKSHLDKLRNRFNDKKESIDDFITGVRNYLEYGHATWYSWSIANWGTKWNSYECEKENDNTFTFETAWSGVPELIEIMSLAFPKVSIEYEWSDEDTGANCGSIVYLNGIFNETKFENGSNEAYELAFKLRPDIKDWYQLIDGEYEYIDENE